MMKIDNWKEFIVYTVLITFIITMFICFKNEQIVIGLFTIADGIKISEVLLQIVKSMKL